VSKPVKFVTAHCQCGASFQREVKRGRPQIWCPACVAVPFYERVKAEVVVSETGETVAVVKADPALRPNDVLGAVRDEIEAGMVEINANHRVQFEALVAAGSDRHAAAAIVQADTHQATLALYAKFR